MTKRRALTEAAKDPAAAKGAPSRSPEKAASAPERKPLVRMVAAVIIGFAGGLLLGRFIKIL